MPRTSAGERSRRSLSWRPGSTVVGPPFLYTPVYVDCAHAWPPQANDSHAGVLVREGNLAVPTGMRGMGSSHD